MAQVALSAMSSRFMWSGLAVEAVRDDAGATVPSPASGGWRIQASLSGKKSHIQRILILRNCRENVVKVVIAVICTTSFVGRRKRKE